MLLEKDVIRLQEYSVFDKITNFINDKESKNTRDSYEADIKQFFQLMRDKEIEYLTEDDLVFEHNHIVTYKNYLKQHYSGSTVNRKLSAIKALYRFLAVDNPKLRMEIFEVGRVKEKTSGYGVLSWEEVEEMIKLAHNKKDGLQKALLIELAARTSIRLEAISTIKWSDIEKQGDYWIISVYDKGEKLDEKPITNEFYERLLQIKGEDEHVFNISTRTLQRTIKELVDEMGLDPSRNITFHSLKKVGINWVIDTTGDITKAAQQGNHSNIQTTYRYYKDRNRDWGSMASVTMGGKVDLSILEGLTKEELLDLIKSLNPSLQLHIANKAKASRG